MKIKRIVIIAISLLAEILSAGTLQMDLSAGGTIQFVGNTAKGEKKGLETVKVIDVKGQKRPQISWNVKDSPYLLFYPKKKITIGNYASLVIKLKLEVFQGCPITSVNLRFVDKNNEVFQYRKLVDLKKGGIFDIEIPVDRKHFSVCWGGKPANKLVDQPLKNFHIVFDYSRKTPQDVKVIFHSMTVAAAPATAVVRPLYEIGDCTQFNYWTGDNASIQVMPRVLNIFGISKYFRFSETKDSLTPYTEPIDGLQIDGCMLNGTAMIRASFRDAAEKSYLTKQLPLTGKRSVLFLPFPNEKGIKYPIYLKFIELKNTGTSPASTAIYSVCSVRQQSRLEAIDFSIGTDTRVGVLRKGHENALIFKFINRSSRKGEYTADVIMQHYSGKPLKEHFEFTLLPGKAVTVEPKMKPDLWGHWDVTAVIREKNNLNESVRKESAFAYLDPAGPTTGRAPGFLFSICTHTERWSPGEQAKEIEALSLCGAKVARVGNTWHRLQPTPDEWRWEPLDRLVNNYGAAGVEVQYILGYPPRWATRKEFHKLPWIKYNRSAPDDAIWRKYISDMVQHFRGRIFYWENWNEPDLISSMTNEEYVRMQKSAFEEIRKAAPEAVVMSGGFATMADHVARKKTRFYDDFFKNAKGYFDVHAQHEHGLFSAYAAVIDGKFFPIRKKYGITGPWYANETAMHSMGGAVRMQAETLFKKLIFSWARGAIGYTWYDLRNDGFRDDYAEHHFGMMTNDFVPKPVYSVFNMLAGTFRTAKFIKQWKPGGNLWAFEFQDGAKRYLAAWDESPLFITASHPIRIVTDAKSAAKIDLMGNKTRLPIYNGCCIFEFGNEPAVLELGDCKKLVCAGELIEFNSKGVAVPGIRYPVRTVIYNPWKQKVSYTLSISGITKKVQVAANGKAELAFETVPTPEPLTLKWENSVGLKGLSTIPVYKATLIPAGDFDKRTPDFVLDKRTQVFSLVEAFPATAHRVWKGPKDQSMKGWAGVFGNEVRFRFDVTDDIHKQPHSGSNVWKSDNIQLAFEIPGQRGYWEFGFSRLDSGKSEATLFTVPADCKAAEVLKAVRITTKRTGDLTQYQISIPFSALKTTAEKWKSGIRLNFIVNEDDGEGRDGWLQYAPGIGDAKDTSKFPVMIFK